MTARQIALAGAMAALAAASCDSPDPGVGGSADPRALEVQFISIGAGIEQDRLASVHAILCEGVREGDVRWVLATPRGIEGEVTLCIEYVDSEAAEEASGRIREVIGDSDVGRSKGPGLTRSELVPSCDPAEIAPSPMGPTQEIDPCEAR